MLGELVNDTWVPAGSRGEKKKKKKGSFEVFLFCSPPLAFAQDELAFQI